MEQHTLGKPRLNPFAFPAETDVRFNLLIIAVLMLAVEISLAMPYLFNSEQENPFAKPLELAAMDAPAEQYFAHTESESLRMFGVALSVLILPVSLILAMLLLALIIFRSHPSRLRRQKKLISLSKDKDLAFQREVRRLAGLAGVSPPPKIELGPELKSPSGQAFGFNKNYILRLDQGLRLQLRKTPAVFRAVVLHELAHIANRDVGRTYFAQALWTAAIFLSIVPVAIAIAYIFIQGPLMRLLQGGLEGYDWRRLFTQNLPAVLLFCLQVVAILGIVAAIRASLLRVREVYADWRAALWGAERPLMHILKRNADREQGSSKGQWWRLHPTAQERLSVLQNPTGLFRLTLDLPFVAGFLMAWVLAGGLLLALPSAIGLGTGLNALTANLANSASANSSNAPLFLAFLLVFIAGVATIGLVIAPIFGASYLVAGTVGIQIQREVIAEMVMGRRGCGPYLRLWIPAALIALGLEVGFFSLPFALLSPVGAVLGETANHPLILSLLIPWLIGVTIMTWLCLAYTRFFGQRWLGTHLGISPPKWKRRCLTLSSSGLLGAVYLPLLLVRQRIIFLFDAATSQFLMDAFITTLLISLVLFSFIFGATWLLIQAERLIRPPRCPSCRKTTRQNVAVGHVCEHCHRVLAPWLFISS